MIHYMHYYMEQTNEIFKRKTINGVKKTNFKGFVNLFIVEKIRSRFSTYLRVLLFRNGGSNICTCRFDEFFISMVSEVNIRNFHTFIWYATTANKFDYDESSGSAFDIFLIYHAYLNFFIEPKGMNFVLRKNNLGTKSVENELGIIQIHTF